MLVSYRIVSLLAFALMFVDPLVLYVLFHGALAETWVDITPVKPSTKKKKRKKIVNEGERNEGLTEVR